MRNKWKKWNKEPKTKIFKYEVGFFPAPTRDNGIGVDIEVHLCCNKLSYWLVYTDGGIFCISDSKFQEYKPEAYKKFQEDFLKYKQENPKKQIDFSCKSGILG